MTIPSHIAVGYMLARGFMAAHLIPSNLVPYVYGVSIVSANFPDMDAVLFKKIYDHRKNSPFHYPFTWWVMYMTTIILLVAEHQRFLLPLVYLSIAGTLSHFLLDTLGVNAGICWFAPFYKKEYSFLKLRKKPVNVKEWILHYITNPVMIVEVTLWITGLTVFFVNR